MTRRKVKTAPTAPGMAPYMQGYLGAIYDWSKPDWDPGHRRSGWVDEYARGERDGRKRLVEMT